MSHEILQGFHTYATPSHVRAVGMTANVWSNLWHLQLVQPIILLTDVLEIFFPMEGNHRIFIFIKIKEAAIPSIIGSTFK